MNTPTFYKGMATGSFVTGFGYGYLKGYSDGSSQSNMESESGPTAEAIYYTIASRIHEKINAVMNNYEISNTEEIKNFLEGNTPALSLVCETYYKICSFIPTTKKITLELLEDPEENRKNLIAKINSNLPINQALDELDRFDQGWFASKFIDSDMLFNISLSFD